MGLVLGLGALAGCTTDGRVALAAPFEGEATLRVYPAGTDCRDLDPADVEASLGEPLDRDTVVRGGTLDIALPSEPLTLVASYVSADGCAHAVACEAVRPGDDVRLAPSSVRCEEGCRNAACERSDAGPRDAGPPDAGPPDAGPPDAGCCPNRSPEADCDGDGLSNRLEQDGDGGRLDSDEDGVPDECDLDSDDDGLPDANECPLGVDNCLAADGVQPAYRNEDSDDDGLKDGQECCGWDSDLVARFGGDCDPDGDELPAHLDSDSDGDGIWDADERGYAGCLSTPADCPPQHSDDDGVCNSIDPDSDGDLAMDAEECANPRNRDQCSAPYRTDQIHCPEEVTDLGLFCGSCALAGCGELSCQGPICGPSSTLEIAVDGAVPMTMPGESIEGDVSGEIVFRSLSDVSSYSVRAPVRWHSRFQMTITFPDDGDVLSRLIDAATASCVDREYWESAQCVAVYEVSLQQEGGTACRTLDRVLLVSTYPNAGFGFPSNIADPHPHREFPSTFREHVGPIVRGWRWYERNAGRWTASSDAAPVVVRPDGACASVSI